MSPAWSMNGSAVIRNVPEATTTAAGPASTTSSSATTTVTTKRKKRFYTHSPYATIKTTIFHGSSPRNENSQQQHRTRENNHQFRRWSPLVSFSSLSTDVGKNTTPTNNNNTNPNFQQDQNGSGQLLNQNKYLLPSSSSCSLSAIHHRMRIHEMLASPSLNIPFLSSCTREEFELLTIFVLQNQPRAPPANVIAATSKTNTTAVVSALPSSRKKNVIHVSSSSSFTESPSSPTHYIRLFVGRVNKSITGNQLRLLFWLFAGVSIQGFEIAQQQPLPHTKDKKIMNSMATSTTTTSPLLLRSPMNNFLTSASTAASGFSPNASVTSNSYISNTPNNNQKKQFEREDADAAYVWVHPYDVARCLRLLHKKVLVDQNGFFYATTQREVAILHIYGSVLGRNLYRQEQDHKKRDELLNDGEDNKDEDDRQEQDNNNSSSKKRKQQAQERTPSVTYLRRSIIFSRPRQSITISIARTPDDKKYFEDFVSPLCPCQYCIAFYQSGHDASDDVDDDEKIDRKDNDVVMLHQEQQKTSQQHRHESPSFSPSSCTASSSSSSSRPSLYEQYERDLSEFHEKLLTFYKTAILSTVRNINGDLPSIKEIIDSHSNVNGNDEKMTLKMFRCAHDNTKKFFAAEERETAELQKKLKKQHKEDVKKVALRSKSGGSRKNLSKSLAVASSTVPPLQAVNSLLSEASIKNVDDRRAFSPSPLLASGAAAATVHQLSLYHPQLHQYCKHTSPTIMMSGKFPNTLDGVVPDTDNNNNNDNSTVSGEAPPRRRSSFPFPK